MIKPNLPDKKMIMRTLTKNDEYFYEIVHDLKAPVLSVDFALKNAERDDLLEEIYRINKHNLNYIENMLTGYSLSKGKYCPNFEEVDLLKILKEEIRVLNFLIFEKNLKVNINIETQKKTVVLTDKQLARQIILNLLTNAVKYTKNGGDINISFLGEDKFLKICFLNEYDNKYLKTCSSKMGLEIVKRKIKAINGKFKISKNLKEFCFNIGFKA